MQEFFKKRRGLYVEEIEKIVELKASKSYQEDGVRSFRDFIRKK